MKRLYQFLIVGCFCLICCGAFGSSDVFAGEVSSAYVYDYDTYWYGNDLITDFYVTIDCGRGCEISDDFQCCGTHSQLEWTGTPGWISETGAGSYNGYDYYNIVLYPGSNSYQPACGQIRKPSNRTLTAYAAVRGTFNATNDTRTYLTDEGSTTTNRGDSWTKSGKVKYGGNAKVDTSKFNPTGYSWYKWGSSCDDATTRDCARNNLTADTNVYAYYTRNHFKGQARVFEGDSISGNAKANTGYVDSDSTQNAEMECANSGCKATNDLYLKTIAGSGKTNFSSNASSLLHSSPYAPSASGTKIKEITMTLYPGGSACYHITFKPYGSLSNTATGTA